MARKLHVVLSQGQSANPIKRKLEEDLVGALLMERGIEITVVPHLYDLKPDGTGLLALQNIPGDMVFLGWLFPRAAYWTLDRNGIRGTEGVSLLAEERDEDEDDESADELADKARVDQARPKPQRSIYCIDLRARTEPAAFVDEIRRIHQELNSGLTNLVQWLDGLPKPEHLSRLASPANDTSAVDGAGRLTGLLPVFSAPAPPAVSPAPPLRVEDEPARRWYPVIDYSRCTNCLECIDFCLFGVYGIDKAETILVEQPDNCRKGCPACSRVCPENAIIFPQHKSPAIAGSASESAGSLKIDLSKLFGAPDGIDQAVRERDVELVAAGRDAVGHAVGIPKRQNAGHTAPKDDLDRLMDQLDELEL